VAGQPLDVELALRPGAISLTVVGGEGMGPRELEREYLRWRASPKRAGERIGRFGQGGMAAIGQLGARFAIAASPAGDPRAYGFVDDAYRDRSRLRTYELHERQKPVAAELGYVRIEIGAVDRRLDGRRVRARLADVYRPLLASGDLALRVDRAPVTPADWPVQERRDIAVRAGGRLVRGWFGLLSELPAATLTRASVSTTSVGWSERRSGSATRVRTSTRPSTAWSVSSSCRTCRSPSTRATSSAGAPDGPPSRNGSTACSARPSAA
jgi:hypothetical protein